MWLSYGESIGQKMIELNQVVRITKNCIFGWFLPHKLIVDGHHEMNKIMNASSTN